MIGINVINHNNNIIKEKNERNERFGLSKMVRLPNLINKTIFRTKGIVNHESDIVKKRFSSREVLNINEQDEKSPSLNNGVRTKEENGFENEEHMITLQNDYKNIEKQIDLFGTKAENRLDLIAMKTPLQEKRCHNVSDDRDFDEDLAGKSAEELTEQIKFMRRSFLFEHNNLLEKCELEKFELRESYEEEKTRLKKAFENEKMEFLKEIERKDKMLEKLAVVLKEQYQKDLESIQSEFEQKETEKSDIINEISETVESIILNTSKIVVNNQTTFDNLDEFSNLKECQKKMTDLMESLEKSSRNKTLNESISDIEKDLILTRSVSAPVSAKVNTPEIRQNSEPDLRQTVRSRSFEPDDRSNEDIQHEMAAVYRKQKADLVKLFNAEKEEDRKRLDQDKNRFEREVRTEYESRMAVERKAWQDTIEDLEREIKILKYEREQLDRNYCLGMDEVRTEFEKEKQQIYKMYSETQTMYENKLRKLIETSAERTGENSK